MALVPAVLGVWGNASFSQAVPVRVPSSATSSQPAASPSDISSRDAIEDRVDRLRDRDGLDDTPSARPAGSSTRTGDDHGRHHRSESETGDDRGGDHTRPDVEDGHHSGADDVTEHHGGGRGSGDNGGDDQSGGSSGHGSDG